MHIPDWDPSFLTNYDPVRLASLYERANATGVMLYCNSHVGLTNYPAPTGKMHPGLRGRDVVGDLVRELKARDIATCAYYSVLFDNWAVTEHPEWWVSPIRDPDARGSGAALPRYGIVCPSNDDYLAFTEERVRDLLGRYDFDCLFFDMTFWALVCGCAKCRERYEIPDMIDWASPLWCAYQSAREDGMRAFVRRIVSAAKSVRPDLPVYNNFALSVSNWVPGFTLSMAEEVDFLGGDMYGDRTEQLVVSKLMLNLTKNRPAEFMTSLCVNLRDHVRLRSTHDLRMKAFAAAAHGSACLFIDAIDPDGTIEDKRYSRVGRIFEDVAPYEPFLGGEPIEDVAVYHSSESRMSLGESGRHIGTATLGDGHTPHQRAVRGACGMLQRAHIPFGVITRKQLGDLDRYKVIVLPDVSRMDAEEVEAFRNYGGHLYASGWTSLHETKGIRHDDFMLADLFGCSFVADESGSALYVRTRYGDISVMPVRLPAIKATSGEVVATVTEPYAHPEPGTVFDRNWSSIHSWPPHRDSGRPAIVRNGRATYSCVPIEGIEAEANEALFVGLIREALAAPSFGARTHPSVWMSAFDQGSRVVVTFVNYQADLPPVPVRDVELTIRGRFSSLELAPDGEAVPFEMHHGVLHATLDRVDEFALIVAVKA